MKSTYVLALSLFLLSCSDSSVDTNLVEIALCASRLQSEIAGDQEATLELLLSNLDPETTSLIGKTIFFLPDFQITSQPVPTTVIAVEYLGKGKGFHALLSDGHTENFDDYLLRTIMSDSRAKIMNSSKKGTINCAPARSAERYVE